MTKPGKNISRLYYLLTDRQIDDQLLNRLRQSLEPHRSGTIPVHLYYQRAVRAHQYVLARRGVSLRAIVY
ncbi:hypothetical protein ACLB1Q_15445 [Escherichia coli]